MSGLLSITIFLPAVVGLLVLLTRSHRQTYIVAVAGAAVTFVLTLALFVLYDYGEGGIQLIDSIRFDFGNIFYPQYLVGIDGLSSPLILLTGLLGVVAVLYSYRVKMRAKEYFLWLLVLETAVLGVFASLDLLQFFIFFEFEVLPMYFIISTWGSGARRGYSATKFVLFTLAGGAFMLAAIALLFFSQGINTLAMVSIPELDIVGIPELVPFASLAAPGALIFSFFLIGFCVKLPVWPLHTWLPDAHTDAPTAGSILLAGVLLKMGGYGIFRICLSFFSKATDGFTIHDATLALSWIATVSTIYGAVLVIRQTDIKRMIAYSSVSHMGFVLLGVTAVSSSAGTVSYAGLTGAALQMFTHGAITGLSFLTVGMIYDRLHTRYIGHMGGLIFKLPWVGILFMIAGLASLGLPLLAGFSAEILIFLGTFSVWPWQTAIAAFSVVLAAGYVLLMAQKIFLGERPTRGVLASDVYDNLKDVRWYEYTAGVLLVVPIVLIGFWPSLIADAFDAGIRSIFG